MILDLMSDIASKMSLLTKYKGDKGHKSPSDVQLSYVGGGRAILTQLEDSD